jgi:Protein of unknown function (DUF3500)
MVLLKLVIGLCLIAVTAQAVPSLALGWARASAGQAGSNTTENAVTAANAFLATLDDSKRAKANIALTTQTRAIWSNLPTGITLQTGATERNGLKLADMTPVQEKAALALVAAVLSRDGYTKTMQIVDADQSLETRSRPGREATSRIRFGRGEFYLAILGKPAATDLWMIQFGGHHLGINVTLSGRENVLTPTHTGTQPASYSIAGRTIRPLGDENDKAFALMNALSSDQQKRALLGYEVRNIVLGPGTDGKMIQPEGIKGSALSDQQRAMLLDLAREWIDIIGDQAAAAKAAEVKANLADTYFAWAGSTTNGQPAYFRIQGPTVFIEYAPQGAGVASTDHIHTIYRDPTNDYLAKATSR